MKTEKPIKYAAVTRNEKKVNISVEVVIGLLDQSIAKLMALADRTLRRFSETRLPRRQANPAPPQATCTPAPTKIAPWREVISLLKGQTAPLGHSLWVLLLGSFMLTAPLSVRAYGDLLPRGFDRLAVESSCGYSYGVAVFQDEVYFTDFNEGTVSRVREGKPEVVLRGYPGAYGIAGAADVIYFATDGDDQNAVIHRWTPGQKPEAIVRGLTRPRQLFVDPRGQLLIALETEGEIVCLDPASGKLSTVVEGVPTAQAAVVDAEGRVFFNQYGTMGDAGEASAAGQTVLLKPDGGRQTLAEGWRTRGLSLLSNGHLGVFTEANKFDQGNTAIFRVVGADGSVRQTIEGFDYPEFAARDARDNVYTTTPRDRVVWRVSTAPTLGSEQRADLGAGFVGFATLHGRFAPAEEEGQDVKVNGGRTGPVAFKVQPDAQGRFVGWIRLPLEEFPDVPRGELAYPDAVRKIYTPGTYAVPEVQVHSGGRLRSQHVVCQRSQVGSRWPMTNVGTAQEEAAAGFSERPAAYLLFVDLEFSQ